MRLFLLTICFALICWLTAGQVQAQKVKVKPEPPAVPATPARPAPYPKPAPEPDEDQEPTMAGKSEETLVSMPTVIVSFCGGTSDVTVRGWDRNEVRARVETGETVKLKAYTESKTAPASRIEVSIPSVLNHYGPGMCRSTADLQLDVPRGAIVELRTNEGDVDVENIARLRAESLNGSFSLRNITKGIDATSFNGDVTIERSRGSLNLRSISGTVEVRDSASGESGDGLVASSVSGEIALSNCGFAQVRANSVTGDLMWNGPLSTWGKYDLATTNGDITMVLPADSSFRVSARVAAQGRVDTQFALKSEGDTSFRKLAEEVTGTYGSGNSKLDLTTFNGTIRLRKK